MRITKFSIVSAIIVLAFSCNGPASAIDFYTGSLLGYNGGHGLQVNSTLGNFAKDFPFKVKLSVGYVSRSPGNALDARKIFINNNTNGTPKAKGWVWDFRMDLLYPVAWFSMKRSFLYLGPRYDFFTGYFSYIGGNEEFDVSARNWGWGIGLEMYFAMSSQIDLVFSTGLDYFLPATFHGHDTSYSPNGQTINGREDYTYKDADKAINQPDFEYRIMIGFNFVL